MASTKRRYSKGEFARRGDEVHGTLVRLHLNIEDDGTFAAVDIESGESEIHEDELEACDKLSARPPRCTDLVGQGRLALLASARWPGKAATPEVERGTRHGQDR